MDKTNTMLAAIVESSGDLVVRDVPIPNFGPYQALVRMRYGATCAGTDLRLLRKQHPNPIAYPAVLGHESVGIIQKTGDKVRFLRIGDLISRVGTPAMPDIGLGICWGGFCQYGVATDWQAMAQDGLDRKLWEKARVQQVIPNDIPQTTAPMIITWRETLSYLTRVDVHPGESVLIAGSGANALSFLCHVHDLGSRAVTIGSQARGNDMLRLGADVHVDYHTADLSKALSAAFPGGIDHIIDAVGCSDNVNAALPLLKKNGCISAYGWNDRQGYCINPFCSNNSFRIYSSGYDEAETHGQIIERIRRGALRAEDWYDTQNSTPLCDIAYAYDNLKQKKAYKYLIDLG